MRRHSRSRARVIAYAVPQEQRNSHQIAFLAAAVGLLSSIAIYVVASMIF